MQLAKDCAPPASLCNGDRQRSELRAKLEDNKKKTMARKSFSVQEVLGQLFEESDIDSASGEKSFYTDEELDYLQRLDPVEE